MQTLSEEIRNCRDGVVKNPFQGTDKKVLFVCSMGILRSATGARLYAGKYNTRGAGSYRDALIPVSVVLLMWADEIVFVNEENYANVIENYKGNKYFIEDIKAKSKVLNIPDKYEHMHPKLIEAFEEQYEAL